MLKVKRMLCLFFLIFILFNISDIGIITPFNALATDVVKDKNVGMIFKNKIQLIKPIDNCYKKTIQALEKVKEAKEKEPEWKEFVLTFYTSLKSENSCAGSVTCQGKKLTSGGVANNVIPLNTKLYLEGYGQVTVNDKGSDKYFGVDNRLDVYVERESGESDRHYLQRVNNYGVEKVKGYVIK